MVGGTVVVVAGPVVGRAIVVDAAVGGDAEDGDAAGVPRVQALRASEPTMAPAIPNLLARITPCHCAEPSPHLQGSHRSPRRA